MSKEPEIQIPRVKLGNQGLEVSKLGFGCAGLSGTYNDPLPVDVGIPVIKGAFNRGITFFDTSDVYGPKTNEILVGKALKQLPRDKIQLATKFGIVKVSLDGLQVNGSPEYVRECCEASLKRLDVDYIDLYYQHRVDQSVSIEDTMGELKKLVEEGKIKYIGLSEASPDTIRRAHAIHPITALQMEWSLWCRDIEEEIIPLCRELGIAIVTYSPLGRGFFAGKAVTESIPANSLLNGLPRFTGENLEKNKVLYKRLANLAAKHGCTPAQLALAWVLHQGDDVVPIPGTTKLKNLDENIGSLGVKLTGEDIKEISDAVPIDEVSGAIIDDKDYLDTSTFLYFLPIPYFSSVPRLNSVCGEMSEAPEIHFPRVKLGNQGLEVSKLGFGCAGLTGGYHDPLSEEVVIQVIMNAFNKGITFFDTADVYGANANEILVGKAMKQLPRDKIQLATKFGLVSATSSGMQINGTPEYARKCCEASLKRLDVDYIDLYYQHRVDKSVPIEDTVGELKKLVAEGKIKYIGLSEASPDTIRRAHAVHPITAVQIEWSLWTRDIEEEIVPLCRELGIGIVAYCPLGRGFFGGSVVLPANGYLAGHPRFTGDNLEKNKILYSRIENLAAKHGCTPAQLALSWVLYQGNDVVPIPGTTKLKNLDENIGSLAMKLTGEDIKEISDAVPIDEVLGCRIHESIYLDYSWEFANTTLKDRGQASS
ncbi:hypothetical protein NE237_013402 [Protea cynaroides]|uniref:NADP-dependent oxidoreductase domain-containing protein n=1 Tax=Protea cynaroides TaxID=273540 RepID=A0A9Q0H3U4_9MAGN|nr:hypothetical protein NE237_013402 [Protea cynaroides]